MSSENCSRIIVTIDGGLHRGASAVFHAGKSVVLGSESDSDLVLVDAGVCPKHCRLTANGSGIDCIAISGDVLVAGDCLSSGERRALGARGALEIGNASLVVELLHVSGAPQARKKNEKVSMRWRSPVTFALVMILGVCGISITNGSFIASAADASDSTAATVRRWVELNAPKESELRVDLLDSGGVVLTGYVQNMTDLAQTKAAIAQQSKDARVAITAVSQMRDSLNRLIRLESLVCEPLYQGLGQFECEKPVESDVAAEALQHLVAQVPGVLGLQTKVVAPPVQNPPTKTASVERPAVKPDEPVDLSALPKTLQVFISDRERVVFDMQGNRWRKGDLIGKFKVARIDLNEVEFVGGGQYLTLHIATLQ